MPKKRITRKKPTRKPADPPAEEVKPPEAPPVPAFNEDAPDLPPVAPESPEAVSPDQIPPQAPPASPSSQHEPVLVDVPKVMPQPETPPKSSAGLSRFGSLIGIGTTSDQHTKLGFMAYQLYCSIERLISPGVTQAAYPDLPENERHWWENAVAWMLTVPGAPANYAHQQLLNRQAALPPGQNVRYDQLPMIAQARYVAARVVTRAEVAALI